MTSEYLKSKIENINCKFPNINYGGCGTFSYHLQKVLSHKYNVSTEIYYIKSPNPPGLMPSYDIKFRHILVRFGDFLIDNNGLHQMPKNDDSLAKLSTEKLEEMINIPELWNNVFDIHTKEQLIKEIYLI